MMRTDEAITEFFKDRPPLDTLLYRTLKHRLFLTFLLVGKLTLPPREVLNLRWEKVDLIQGQMTPQQQSSTGRVAGGLFNLHATRQRQDRREAPTWISPERVMVDHYGCPYLMADADEVLAGFCQDLGLPEVTLATIGSLDLSVDRSSHFLPCTDLGVGLRHV